MDDIVTALLCLVMSCAFSMVALFLHVKKIEKNVEEINKRSKVNKNEVERNQKALEKMQKIAIGSRSTMDHHAYKPITTGPGTFVRGVRYEKTPKT